MKLWAIVDNQDYMNHGVAGIYTTRKKAKKAFHKEILEDEILTVKEILKDKKHLFDDQKIVIENKKGNIVPIKKLKNNTKVIITGWSCFNGKETTTFRILNNSIYQDYGGYSIVEITTDEWFDDSL